MSIYPTCLLGQSAPPHSSFFFTTNSRVLVPFEHFFESEYLHAAHGPHAASQSTFLHSGAGVTGSLVGSFVGSLVGGFVGAFVFSGEGVSSGYVGGLFSVCVYVPTDSLTAG